MPAQYGEGSASRGLVVAPAVVAALAGLALLAKQRAATDAAKPEMTAVRTLTIATGDMEKTIRVSGVVTAERFAALMAPRLRGSRGASGSYGSGKSLVGNSSSSTSTSSTATSSSTSSSSTSSTASSSQSGTTSTSTNTAVTGQTAGAGAPGAPASSLG